jgi:hypothetical protein
LLVAADSTAGVHLYRAGIEDRAETLPHAESYSGVVDPLDDDG